MRYKRIGYNINVMRQSAYLVINPVTVGSFASLANCKLVGRASDICRKENPQKSTQLSPRSYPRQLTGKRTAQRDVNKDIISDSQVNSQKPKQKSRLWTASNKIIKKENR